jgi:glycerol-3-phosphate cytidylyltransferase
MSAARSTGQDWAIHRKPEDEGASPDMTTVITFGTFDVLHVGHLRILQRSRELGDRLVVGVSSDALNMAKKGRAPVFSEDERCELVANLKCVDEVFLEESLELKREYVQKYHADVLVMGDDWAGRFDELNDICRVVYLPRTPSISTTGLIEHIGKIAQA